MKGKPTSMSGKKLIPLYERIRQILEAARTNISRTVNTTQVVANWLVGREIVEEEQQGKTKADYGERLLPDLSARLKEEFGPGYSVDNLEMFRRFYSEYSALISEAMSRKLDISAISDAPRRKFPSEKTLSGSLIGYALREGVKSALDSSKAQDLFPTKDCGSNETLEQCIYGRSGRRARYFFFATISVINECFSWFFRL